MTRSCTNNLHKCQITAEPDVFEIHGDWIKRQCRTEWLIARQAFNAAVRATRGDRDAARNMPPAWVPPPSSSRRWRCQRLHRRSSVTVEDSHHG
jgi:hypothetical protein